MATKRQINLRFPSAGLNRRFSVQSQPPFTTADVLNMRPDGTFEGRERGGSRPGLEKAYGDVVLGGGEPVNMMGSVLVFPGEPSKSENIDDDFSSYPLKLSSPWLPVNSEFSAVPFMGVTAAAGLGGAVASIAGQQGINVLPRTTIDWTSPLTGHFIIVPWDIGGATTNALGTWRVWLFTQPIPSPLHGFYFEFRNLLISGDRSFLTISTHFVNESSDTLLASEFFGELPLDVLKGDIIKVEFDIKPGPPRTTTLIWNIGVNADEIVFGGADSGYRDRIIGGHEALFTDDEGNSVHNEISFGVELDNSLTEEFALDLSPSITTAMSRLVADWETEIPRASAIRNITVLSSGGRFYQDDGAGSLEEIEHNTDLSGEKWLQAAAHDQSLYIADYGLTGDESDEDKGPKVWDAATGELSRWVGLDKFGEETNEPGLGKIPLGNRLVTVMQDSVFLGGGPDEPQNIFKSRAGDPFDWDFSGLGGHLVKGGGVGGSGLLDVDRPIDFTTTPLGKIGEPVTALVPHSKDYLVVGAVNSLWVLINLGLDVYANNLSRKIGIQGPDSWTQGPSGELVFLSRDGLYVLGPAADAVPISLSRERLPQELVEVDPGSTRVHMIYDTVDRGVLILLDNQTVAQEHWWFDWETKGFYPFRYERNQEATAVGYRQKFGAGPGASVILGGRDGVVRLSSSDSFDDDGVPFESHVLYGPINLGGSGFREALVAELLGTTAVLSGDVTWGLQVGDSEERALGNVAQRTGVWEAGPNRKVRPRLRGSSLYLRLSSQSRWAIESVLMRLTSVGESRR